jgi:hypothetical protein
MSQSSTEQRELPNWIFDISADDDEDDDEDEGGNQVKKSLMEELEIDPKHIYR